MQLLERKDRKKWFLWIAQGKQSRANPQTKVFAHFTEGDAIASFKTYFEKYTENNWSERDFFKAVAGKYELFSEQRDKEKLQIGEQNDKELA